MRIEHIAIWTKKLEELKEFYEKFFDGKANEKYVNVAKGFESYFIKFADGSRLELMKSELMKEKRSKEDEIFQGYTHIAFELPSEDAVNRHTQIFQNEGITHLDGPRITGDGYYEAKFMDPDGNIIELVAKR